MAPANATRGHFLFFIPSLIFPSDLSNIDILTHISWYYQIAAFEDGTMILLGW
jgi:hypothetical protein